MKHSQPRLALYRFRPYRYRSSDLLGADDMDVANHHPLVPFFAPFRTELSRGVRLKMKGLAGFGIHFGNVRVSLDSGICSLLDHFPLLICRFLRS
jgi:hypothetical protein